VSTSESERARVTLRELFRRVGSASPLVPAAIYTVAVTLGNLATTLAPHNALLVLAGFLLWLVGSLFVFIVVTWYRDDDWLAAGFLLGVTILVGNLIASIVAGIVTTGSIGEAVFTAASASMALFVRALILVPLCGGIVTAARWLGRTFRRRRDSTA
jgi:hypothetical protein